MDRHLNRLDHSKFWLQGIGAASWLAGAGLCAAWMVHGGGVARPLAVFAVWATGVCFITARGLAGTSDVAPTMREAAAAVRYGAFSVVALALGTLFFEYWPVTVSMAFMFAICRTIKSEDTPAYS